MATDLATAAAHVGFAASAKLGDGSTTAPSGRETTGDSIRSERTNFSEKTFGEGQEPAPISAWQVLTSGVVLLLCAIAVMLFFSQTFDFGDKVMRFLLESVVGMAYLRSGARTHKRTPLPRARRRRGRKKMSAAPDVTPTRALSSQSPSSPPPSACCS